jgi:hypothetical protein
MSAAGTGAAEAWREVGDPPYDPPERLRAALGLA